MSASCAPTLVPFAETLRFWLKPGFVSFGGPAGQIALMQRRTHRAAPLDQRAALPASAEPVHAASLPRGAAARHLPRLAGARHGRRNRRRGAVRPASLPIEIGLSWICPAWGRQPVAAGPFYGIKPAVTANVARAAWRIGRRTLQTAWSWALAGTAFVATFVRHLPFRAIVPGAAVVGAVAVPFAPPAFRGAGGGARPGTG